MTIVKVRFTPDMLLHHVTTARGIRLKDLGVKPIVVGAWMGSVTRGLASRVDAEVSEHWPYRGSFDLYAGRVGETPVSFATFPVGAPATVVMIEELIAAGARRIVGLGLGGSLQPEAPVGSVLLPCDCIRDEGTSLHYLPADHAVSPDPHLQGVLREAMSSNGLAVHAGLHWTTDALYREFDWKIRDYRARGVIGVDMETSAMYALGLHHQCPVANLLVVSDELWEDWRPAFGRPELRTAIDGVMDALLGCLPALASEPG